MNRDPLVTVEELRKTYSVGEELVHALKGINLKVFSGESVAIMGPSGSGKSTLLHLLGCLDSPSAGLYLLGGQNISSLSDADRAFLRASQIGFVFQSFNLIPQLNVYENVEVPFLYQSFPISKDEMHQRILDALSIVKLEDRLSHLPSQLSGGETQRVAIARALAIRPLLILADEPTGNLDSETGGAILDTFRELNRQGATLILVTHDEEVAARCRRIVRMRDGEIATEHAL